ncbi:hypothetical protein ACFOD0_01625 [Shewanella intestini]|uniref:Uncharacterized protein n=1 Tax=Shewanella intestini TaxID=2017544 RepID=A0ABS5HZP9_9GAMM|nr:MULTISPECIES: hypothetical protein [Shewanella]MBR9727267.1 hypothetical protein [Shewanella intestini]MRG36069.1 hypothetical protein [Shewanella sp. XMDDZSB0408]
MRKMIILILLILFSTTVKASYSTQQPVVVQIEQSINNIDNALSCSIIYSHSPQLSTADFYKGVVYTHFSNLVEQLMLTGKSEQHARDMVMSKIVTQAKSLEQQLSVKKSQDKSQFIELLKTKAQQFDCEHYAKIDNNKL